MAVKPSKPAEYREVNYTEERWKLLHQLRDEARLVMSALESAHLSPVTHGSLARGDVKQGSDVDVFIPEIQNSFHVELALENAGISICNRLIVQATPTYAMKAHIEINEHVSVTFPLMAMRQVEREF